MGDLHQLHWNDGTGTFTLYAPAAGDALAERHIGRGAAFADLDGDLDLDIIIANAGQPAQILINQAASGHALLVELDTLSAGARVSVEGKDVKHSGRFFQMETTRLWTMPEQAPPIMVATAGPRVMGWAS